nr:coiled-coil domain-containing protein 171-like protein isoform X1 [Pomacea canaliculata]
MSSFPLSPSTSDVSCPYTPFKFFLSSYVFSSSLISFVNRSTALLVSALADISTSRDFSRFLMRSWTISMLNLVSR